MSKVNRKLLLIQNEPDGVAAVYTGFTSRSEAYRYAAALDWFYGPDYDPQGKPPTYLDADLFEKDWVYIEATEVDWEQFGK